MKNTDSGTSQVVLVIKKTKTKTKKNLPANTGNRGNTSSIPGSGRFLGEGHGKPPSILAWRIPWMEDPGGLQFMGSQRVRHN